jgi:hypothetical protein
MKDDQHRFLILAGTVPGRLNAEQVAWLLGCQSHDVPVLVSARLLRPLGVPQPNSVKYFASADILEHRKDSAWLARMTNVLGQRWRDKNQAKKHRADIDLPFEASA